MEIQAEDKLWSIMQDLSSNSSAHPVTLFRIGSYGTKGNWFYQKGLPKFAHCLLNFIVQQ